MGDVLKIINDAGEVEVDSEDGSIAYLNQTELLRGMNDFQAYQR
ncbi:hypothetical protein [Lentilactobacillus kosonis]|uniref:Uncharacterized protein n=1 Tax=Lentilactobacillus kosonis TaxID=2810561 RepID=A0A401FMT9_9LACO|nr:hypothetical protein [Lentilactobacillus kosonis]GAY73588.1 hypothetical protein NBRC111893_1734 [Lentilactobacillus kosonis]